MSQSVLERTDSYADSDASRHARPLKHANRITLTQPLDLELGGRLSGVAITYETYGRLSPSHDNAVLICHALELPEPATGPRNVLVIFGQNPMKTSRKIEFRILRAALWATVLATSMGARRQSANFVVDTADPSLAVQIAAAAERLRHDLAIEWLGAAIPDWPRACTITVRVDPQLAAGGATTSVYDRGEVFVWRMTIQGPVERIFDSVLPHEMTHAIFASYFHRQLPRWADEGGATNVELASQKAKYREMLLKCLGSGRGIAFNQMFAMTEYPADSIPLYTQGYALAEFLIQRGGRRKYVDFLTAGLKRGQWSAEVRRHYGMADLGELQTAWSAWIASELSNRQPANAAASIASSSPRDGTAYRSK